MDDWNKDLGISKKAWEGLKPSQRNRMLNIFNKSPKGKKLKKVENKSKAKAKEDLKITKTKRKLKDNVSTVVNAEKIKIRNKRLIEEALESQYRKNNPTSKVTTQGDKAPTLFLRSIVKHFKK
tara:strand:- start:107 stop:475 length:369 start_codon:yes stop_codon:yes gene_type:complete